MSNESIRKRLKEEDSRKKLENQYKYLTSKVSQKYIQYLMFMIGSEIEHDYPGIVFRLIERNKSEVSHEIKREKVSKRQLNKDRKIFDTLGFCLIIEHIPFDVNIEHKLCQNHLIERAKKYTQKEEIELKLKKTIQEFKMLETKKDEEIKEYELKLQNLQLQANNSEQIREYIEQEKQRLERAKRIISKEKEIHKEHINCNKKLIQAYQEQYNIEDKEANNALARHILNKIIDSLKKLGINRIPARSKIHDGGKSGCYVACHDSLISDKIKNQITSEIKEMVSNNEINVDNLKEIEDIDWVIEFKAMSIQNDKDTKVGGDAQHSKCKGKERVLPAFGNTGEENNKFKDRVLKNTPQFMVYQSSKKREDGTVQKGKVYVCSEIENVVYYYLEALENNPELFKHIIGRKDLFSDKSRVIAEEDIEI